MIGHAISFCNYDLHNEQTFSDFWVFFGFSDFWVFLKFRISLFIARRKLPPRSWRWSLETRRWSWTEKNKKQTNLKKPSISICFLHLIWSWTKAINKSLIQSIDLKWKKSKSNKLKKKSSISTFFLLLSWLADKLRFHPFLWNWII
jgi:hypothetical protein